MGDDANAGATGVTGNAPRETRIAAAILAVAALALSVVCFAGLWLGHRSFIRETGFGLMAPATAIVVALLACAALLLITKGDRGWARTIVTVAACLIVVASLIGTVQHLGWALTAWDPEPFLTSDAARAAGLRPKHVSPALGGLLVLSSLALLLLALDAGRRSARRRVALVVALAVALTGVATALIYASRLPIFFATTGQPISPGTAVALAIVGTALMLMAGLVEEASRFLFGAVSAQQEIPPPERRRRLVLLASFGALLLVAPMLVVAYLRHIGSVEAREAEEQLVAVAELKQSQVAAWYAERMGDARSLMRSPSLNEAVAAVYVSSSSSSASPARMRGFLDGLRRNYGYESVILFDREGRLVEASPSGAAGPGREVVAALGAAREATDIVVVDLHREAGERIWLDFVAPLVGVDGVSRSGAVWFRVDARARLYPLVQSWPLKTRSARSALVRRDGDALLMLTETPDRRDAALRQRLALDDPDLPAVKAVTTNARGAVEGVDYRGVPAMLVARPVPGTPWFLVAKIDLEEVHEGARVEAFLLGVGLLLLVALATVSVAFLWRQRNQELIERERAAERNRADAAERLALVMRHANDCVLLIDDRLRVVEANERAVTLYGYPAEELLSMDVGRLRADETRAALAGDLEAARGPEGRVFETLHRRKDGSIFPVEVSSREVELGGRSHRLSIVRDITERKEHEHQIERVSRMYRALSEVSEAVAHAVDRGVLLDDVCRTLTVTGGFELAWVGFPDAEGWVVPVARHGRAAGYMEGLRVSIIGEKAEGRGPTGVAIREARTSLINDFVADASAQPWHERAEAHGIRSCVAIPLHERGAVVGALSVYASSVNFFGEREVSLVGEAARALSFAFDVFVQRAEREAAEKALAENERRLRFLVAATPAMIYSCSVDDFATTFVSDNVTAVLGHTPAELCSGPRFWLEHVHPDDLRGALESAKSLFDLRHVVREYRFRHKDGSWRWMQDELRVVLDDAGRAVEIVGCWLDVTPRKSAEERLRAREELFSAVFSQALDAMAVVDLETGGFVEFNKGAYDGLGYTREEFAALRIADIQAEHSPETIRRNIEEIRAHGFSAFETRHRRKDGEPRDVQVRSSLIELGGRPHIAAVWTDITESKRLERELLASEERYRLIAENTSDMIWLADIASGEFTYVSPASRSLRGYEPEEIVGKTIWDFQPPATRVQLAASLEARLKAVEAGDPGASHGSYEVQLYRKDGTTFWGEVVTTLLTDERGRVTTILGVTRDISERKAIESELRASEARHRLITDSIRDVVWTADLTTGRFVYVSPAVTALHGFVPEDLVGESMSVMLAPSARHLFDARLPARVAAFDAGDESARHRTAEVELMHKDGSTVWTEMATTLVPDENGRASRIFGVTRDITARRKADFELRKLSSAVEQSPVSIVITNLDGAIEYANPYFTKITGYSLDEVRGANPRVLQSGMTPREVFVDMWATLTAGRVWRGELINKKKSGEVYIELAIISPVADADGKVTHYVAVKEDITGRKRAEAALRESEELYRLIAENTSDVIWIYDLATGAFRYMSPSVEKALGFRAEELIGRSFSSVLTPEAAREAAQSLGERIAAWQGGDHSTRSRVLVLDHRHRDGRILHAEVVSNLLSDENGRITQLLGISRDITERVLAEKRLRESAQRLADAQRMAKLGNWEAVVPGGTIWWSDEVKRIWEVDVEGNEIPFEMFVERLHPDDRDRVLREAYETAEQGGSVTIVHRIKLPGGTIKWIRAIVETERGEGGAPNRLVGTQQDITQVKQAELALQVERASLARRVAERTSELSRVNADLARAVTAKDEFLANMSHELRTPLNAILALSESLLEQLRGPLNEKQLKSIRTIETSGRHLLSLITDILDLSKVEAGRMDLQLETVPVADICEASLSFVREMAAKKQLQIGFQLSDHLARVEADPKRLKQMLVNLLSNAVKFTPASGRVSLEVASDAELGVIRFAVKDSGIGISREDLARLFQPFTQIDSSLSRQHDGTGLGLALVRRLAELHGGMVAVESEVGKGSTFTIALPYSGAAKVEAAPAPPAAAPEPLPARALAADMRSALIIEDSESTAEQLARYLEETGLRAVVHPDGKGALEKAVSVMPDVIMLDLLMPGESGWEVLAKLKSDERTRAIPVVIVSVLDEREKGLAAGAAEYLLKPVTREALKTTLERAVPARKPEGRALILAHETREMRSALIVEDSETTAEQLAHYFEEMGIRAVVHPEGGGALEQATDVMPDVIVLDLLMPGESGWDVLAKLKGNARTRGIPVIIASVVDERSKGLAAGAAEYLVKPISRETLRKALDAVTSARRPAAEALIIAEKPAVGGPPARARILLAEDTEANIMAIGDYLVDVGYELVVARNGAEAIEQAIEARPDLILMDVQMPGMDGLEATRRLRDRPEFTAVPIIALTGLAMAGDRERCLASGATEYLTKPVSPKAMVEMMETLLRR